MALDNTGTHPSTFFGAHFSGNEQNYLSQWGSCDRGPVQYWEGIPTLASSSLVWLVYTAWHPQALSLWPVRALVIKSSSKLLGRIMEKGSSTLPALCCATHIYLCISSSHFSRIGPWLYCSTEMPSLTLQRMSIRLLLCPCPTFLARKHLTHYPALSGNTCILESYNKLYSQICGFPHPWFKPALENRFFYKITSVLNTKFFSSLFPKQNNITAIITAVTLY